MLTILHPSWCDHQGACGFSTPRWLPGNITLKSQSIIINTYKAVLPTWAHQTQCDGWCSKAVAIGIGSIGHTKLLMRVAMVTTR